MPQQKIIVTRGLPCSGKSTWARQYQTKNPDTVVVNKDDLRASLYDARHIKGREAFVLQVRDLIIAQALVAGYDVIVDDTHLAAKYRARMEEIAKEHRAIVEIQDFTQVSLEVCIERDRKRANSIGERVIRQLYRQYIETRESRPTHDPLAPNVILCDLDGTLCLFGDANPYERDFSQDEANKSVRSILWTSTAEIILISGRKEKFRPQTELWLRLNGIEYRHLYMRPDEDNRRDVFVKEEIYNKHIRNQCNVLMVIDERLPACRMWHRLGLPLFRFGDPDSDF